MRAYLSPYVDLNSNCLFEIQGRSLVCNCVTFLTNKCLYSAIGTCCSQRHMDDKRFERELKHKEVLQKQADHGASKDAEQV